MPRTAAAVVLVLLALPAAEFFWISLNRMTHPFELEWMEGEMALMSMRWVEEGSVRALYPPFGETDFVPHLYPPLYNMVVGTLWNWFGGGEAAIPLAWGRAVSLLAVMAGLWAVVLIVRESTHSLMAGVAGACVYLAFYRLSGYWYDLYRVDQAANTLSLWAVWLAIRRDSGFGLLLLSFALALAAGLTKQTAVLLPVLAWLARGVWELTEHLLRRRDPRHGLLPRGDVLTSRPLALPLAALLAAVVLANLALVFSRGEWQSVWFYLVEMSAGAQVLPENLHRRGVQDVWQHIGFPLLIPAVGAWAFLLSRRWATRKELALATGGATLTAGAVWSVLLALHAGAEAFLPGQDVTGGGLLSPAALLLVPATWSGGVQLATALLVGAMVLLAVRWVRYRTGLPGVWWLLVLAVSQHFVVLSWVKVGGYLNNLLPLLAVLAIVAGLGYAWLEAAAARRLGPGWRWVGGAVFLLVAAPGWWGTREAAVRLFPGDERFHRPVSHLGVEAARSLPWWVTDGLRANRTVRFVTTDDAGERRIRTYRLRSGNQIPPESGREWNERLLDRVRELAREGPVYLPQQNYLAVKAGLPPGPGASAIREVTYLGLPVPGRYIEPLRQGEYRYVVTMNRLEDEASWLPEEMADAIREHYTLRGPLLRETPPVSLRPVTGARVRPTFVYEYTE